MERDYSWDDQEPEEIQHSLEFNDPLGAVRENDGANFPLISPQDDFLRDTEVDDYDYEDDDRDEDLELEIAMDLKQYLTFQETIVVLGTKGFGVLGKLTLPELADELNVTDAQAEALHSSAVEKLRQIPKYKNWI